MDSTMVAIKKNVETVNLDKQEVFKKLILALTNPGELQCLTACSLPLFNQDLNIALQPMLALLHPEATFHILSRNPGRAELVTRYLKLNTGAGEANFTEADFILCLEGTSRGLFPQLKKARARGADTARNITIFYLVQDLCSGPQENTVSLKLHSGGAEIPRKIHIQGLDTWEARFWIEERADNAPGTDIYLLNAAGKLLSLPRLLKISE